MAEKISPLPLIQTKLHRPPVSRDIVNRQHLFERLEAGRHLPLALVSAPAGYGKSTLISHWLQKSDLPSSWLSLDATDGDMTIFLTYFVAAVQTLFPEACSEVQALLNAAELPQTPVLAGCLSNDLEAIEDPYILVLDDYHRIQNSDVHELLNLLLSHPSRSLHLAILTRSNPPLSLVSLRARHLMTEVRMPVWDYTSLTNWIYSGCVRRPFTGHI